MNNLQRSTEGLFRSLLFQVFQSPSFHNEARALVQTHANELERSEKIEWNVNDLKHIFFDMFIKPRTNETRIIIDALDECEDRARDLLRYFWRLTAAAEASGGRLSVCFSSRPELTVTNPKDALKPFCVEVNVEDYNNLDISSYVAKNLSLGNPGENTLVSLAAIKDSVIEKSSGIFLWVVLVVNILQSDWDNGRDIEYLRSRLYEVPPQLNELYINMIRNVEPGEANELLHILQCVLFAGRPLLISEWHHVMALIKNPKLQSLQAWKRSENFTQSDEQLIKWIKNIARGFLELKDRKAREIVPIHTSDANLSLQAEAGSFESGQYFDVIHETVREFLIHGDGCTLLDPSIRSPQGSGHLFIFNLLVNYGFLEEMAGFRVKYKSDRDDSSDLSSSSSELVYKRQDRTRVYRHRTRVYQHRTSTAVSETSFGTSASSGARAVGWGSNQKSIHSPKSTFCSTPSIKASNHGKCACLLDIVVVSLIIQAEFYRQSRTSDYQVVGEIPALMHYFQNMFLFHAISIEQNGFDYPSVLKKLNLPSSKGWLEGREDMRGGSTLLYYASEWNLNSWVRWICEAGGCSPDLRGGKLKYPLIVATANGHYDVIAYLLEHHAFRHYHDGTGKTALHYAAALRGPRALKIVRILTKQKDGLRPLYGLLNDQQNKPKLTPLHVACRQGSREVVRELLDNGSDRHLLDKLSRTAFHIAARRSSSKIMDELLKEPSYNLEFRDNKGRTPLHIAVSRSSWRVVKKLIDHGALLDATDRQDNTPLHLACSRNPIQADTCELLLNVGCNRDLPNKDLKLAEELVSGIGCEEVLQLFRRVDLQSTQILIFYL